MFLRVAFEIGLQLCGCCCFEGRLELEFALRSCCLEGRLELGLAFRAPCLEDHLGLGLALRGCCPSGNCKIRIAFRGCCFSLGCDHRMAYDCMYLLGRPPSSLSVPLFVASWFTWLPVTSIGAFSGID